MGYSPLLENEEGDAILSIENGDRSDIGLPAAQVEFVKKLATSGARIILVLCGGGPIALGELENMVEAVVFVWYPGQAGGQALAQVLFGDISPSGKLPITFPKSTEQLPPFEIYRMIIARTVIATLSPCILLVSVWATPALNTRA